MTSVRTRGKRSEILAVKIYTVPVTMTNRQQVLNDNQRVVVTIHAIFPSHVILAPSSIVYGSFMFLRYIQVTPEIKPHYRSEGRRQGSCGVFWGLYNTISALYVCVVTLEEACNTEF